MCGSMCGVKCQFEMANFEHGAKSTRGVPCPLFFFQFVIHIVMQGYFSMGTTLRLGIQMLEAIEGCHNLAYIHRDIKPVCC